MHRRTQIKIATSIAVAALCTTTAACGGDSGPGSSGSLKLAPQFGLSYLPDTVMGGSGKDFLQKELPDAKITSVQLSSGGAVVEQLISGAVDVGYMGVGPFLKAIDSGADIKALSCLEEQPLDLMVVDKSIQSLSDLSDKDRIGLPGPSSQQAYTLAVAANKEFGDPAKFDKALAGLPHPDGMAALLNKQDIAGHFTQDPYSGQEEAKGAHSILNSYDVFGRHCLIVAVGAGSLQKDDPKLVEGVQKSLKEAVAFINDDPDGAAKMLAKVGDKTPVDQLIADIKDERITWTTDITGLQAVADAMKDAKILKKTIAVSDVIFDGATAN